ncbi:MAG: hypothetical protein QM433_01990 [Euryarchaeota archaeon]|nr:hypothetical protein [Euryarchaeota archaeon]
MRRRATRRAEGRRSEDLTGPTTRGPEGPGGAKKPRAKGGDLSDR